MAQFRLSTANRGEVLVPLGAPRAHGRKKLGGLRRWREIAEGGRRLDHPSKLGGQYRHYALRWRGIAAELTQQITNRLGVTAANLGHSAEDVYIS